MSKTIMAVGAHTGDAQLTCGMLLAKHVMQGDKVIIVDLTAGERGAPKGRSVAEFRAYNADCAKQFADVLGGACIVLDTPDGELAHSIEAAVALSDIMRTHAVDAVLYHWPNSMHRDHIQANRITEDAIFYASLPTFERPLPPAPIRKFMCAENWEDTEGYIPYFYFDVTDAFPLWKEAIRKLWLAENATFPYLRYYDALSVTRGALIGKERATTFGIPERAKRQILECL